jgi:hypothetical protein
MSFSWISTCVDWNPNVSCDGRAPNDRHDHH